ncbi:MAG: prolipoprotein diacylglyceryl transferase [Actinomycetota bacterium]
MQFWDPFAWEIIPRLDLGPLEISPHGIGIALGYLLGAHLMVRRQRRFGGPDEADIWNALFWALLGAMVGARIGYVLGHLPEVTDDWSDPLGIFKVWEGGISLLGGITGAVIFALPYMIKHKMGFWRSVDLAAPGLALGILIGRLGDLIIGDHLGDPTDLPFGWRCLGSDGQPPLPAEQYMERFNAGNPPSLGCYDIVLHQTALYDFISTAVLFGVLLWVGRKARKPGFLAITYVLWYGAARFVVDFLRNDRRYLGLTGSQLWAATIVLICLYLLIRYRGAPPKWQRPPAPEPEPAPQETHPPATESERETPTNRTEEHAP